MQSYISTGNIYPCRIVKLATTADGKVTQSGAGDASIGISQQGTRRSPYIDSNGYAASAGEPLFVHDLPGEECELDLGGTVTPGMYLKADSNGKGVNAGTDKDAYVAIAKQAGVSGERIKVEIAKGFAAV